VGVVLRSWCLGWDHGQRQGECGVDRCWIKQGSPRGRTKSGVTIPSLWRHRGARIKVESKNSCIASSSTKNIRKQRRQRRPIHAPHRNSPQLSCMADSAVTASTETNAVVEISKGAMCNCSIGGAFNSQHNDACNIRFQHGSAAIRTHWSASLASRGRR